WRWPVHVGCRVPLGSAAGGSAYGLDVFRLGSLLALGDVELDLLPFLQAAVAAAGDRAEVHEHVRVTVDSDEAVALVAVEPLHSALRHIDLLAVDAAPPVTVCGPALARLLPLACHGPRWASQWTARGSNLASAGPHTVTGGDRKSTRLNS